MASASLEVATEWAGQLAQIAETLLEKVPDKDEYQNIRGILQDTSGLLRQGNVNKGVRKLLPYVGKVLTHVDKYMHVSDSYRLAEVVQEHFLVDEQVQKYIHVCLEKVRSKLVLMKAGIEDFGARVDSLLDHLVHGGHHVSVWTFVKLTFQLNRISSVMCACQRELDLIGLVIDELDTHVASKRLLADVITVGSFVGGTVLSMLGNVPAGAACLVSATASRKSAKSLDSYRTQLRSLDHDHKHLQQELTEWKHRFNAEQHNFYLLLFLHFSLMVMMLFVGGAILVSRDCCYGVFALSAFYWLYQARDWHVKHVVVCIIGLVGLSMLLHSCTGWWVYKHVTFSSALMVVNIITLLTVTGKASPLILANF